jgi:hypothetical protein
MTCFSRHHVLMTVHGWIDTVNSPFGGSNHHAAGEHTDAEGSSDDKERKTDRIFEPVSSADCSTGILTR